MRFISTRGKSGKVSSAEAIIKGLADDGGLFVPEYFPKVFEKLKEKISISYEELAFEIIKEFFDDIPEDDLKDAINKAYKGRFEILEKGAFLELYHGPTSAFKDAALLFLPQIMKKAKKVLAINDEIIILTATSGDTGKAALEGFHDVEGFKCVVYYPKDGVSAIQQRQMNTQVGDNVKVIAIEGNFDDAQRGVKNIFADEALKEKLKNDGILLSSANSINIGRLVPQIVYYFYGYFKLVNKQKIRLGEKINVVVPTGNFGNILAAYYSKKMGLPIDRFICASNENNVLSDFFKTGTYDKRRKLLLTDSPSMDILVSSNLERLIFEAVHRDGEKVSNLMKQLNDNGLYDLDESSKEFISEFYGNYATKEEVFNDISRLYHEEKYLMDTHTAVAHTVLRKYKKESKDYKSSLIISTASPYKFPRSICSALGIEVENYNDFQVLDILNSYTKIPIPKNLRNLDSQPILHRAVCQKEDMKKELLSFLYER